MKNKSIVPDGLEKAVDNAITAHNNVIMVAKTMEFFNTVFKEAIPALHALIQPLQSAIEAAHAKDKKVVAKKGHRGRPKGSKTKVAETAKPKRKYTRKADKKAA